MSEMTDWIQGGDVGRMGAVAFHGEAQLGLAAILFRQLHADEPARIPRHAAFADRGVEQLMMGRLRVHDSEIRFARPAMPPDFNSPKAKPRADAARGYATMRIVRRRYIIGQYGATP